MCPDTSFGTEKKLSAEAKAAALAEATRLRVAREAQELAERQAAAAERARVEREAREAREAAERIAASARAAELARQQELRAQEEAATRAHAALDDADIAQVFTKPEASYPLAPALWAELLISGGASDTFLECVNTAAGVVESGRAAQKQTLFASAQTVTRNEVKKLVPGQKQLLQERYATGDATRVRTYTTTVTRCQTAAARARLTAIVSPVEGLCAHLQQFKTAVTAEISGLSDSQPIQESHATFYAAREFTQRACTEYLGTAFRVGSFCTDVSVIHPSEGHNRNYIGDKPKSAVRDIANQYLTQAKEMTKGPFWPCYSLGAAEMSTAVAKWTSLLNADFATIRARCNCPSAYWRIT